MKAYVDDIIVTDASGEKAVLYPKTKQEAVFGLMERLGKLEAPHITETEATTMENSYAGRLEIVNIGGGESEQDKTTGAQLFDGALEQGSFDGVLNKIESAYRVRNSVNRPVTPNKTYTIFSSVAKEASIFELDSEGNFLSILSSFASLPLTFTTSSNGHYIALVLRISDTTAITPNMVNDVMLNEGTEALPWEPYTGGLPAPSPDYPQEIKKTVISEIRTHGKNLFAFGKTAIDRTDELRPNAAQRLQMSLVNDDDLNRIKCGFRNGSWTSGYVTIYGIDGTKDYSISYDIAENTTTYTPIVQKYNSQCDSTKLTLVISGRNESNIVASTEYFILSNIQVELGTATAYEPYTESTITLSQPIELYGIGDVQDVIEDGKIKRKLKKIVFDGSDDEGWAKSAIVGTSRYYVFLNDIFASLDCDFLCSQARKISDTASTEKAVAFVTPAKQFAINTSFATLDEWKAHLQANPMTVVYELVEKAIEELPIVDQIALNNLKTFDEVTYVEFDSEIKPTFKGEYGTSEIGGMVLEGKLAGLNGELYGISNADRIAALEASVVNNI